MPGNQPASPLRSVESNAPPRVETLISVISLSDAMSRRRVFAESAERQGVRRAWSFYPARTTLSSRLSYDPAHVVVTRGREIHPRELACYSSHFEAWHSFLKTNAQQLLVLEDDVQLDWGFVDRVIDRDLAAEGIEYLKLFSKNMTPYSVVSNAFHGRWLLDCRGFAYGMQAYILTRPGARRFVAHCGGLVRRPIDDEMDRSWAHGIPNLTVFPFPAFEMVGPSTIGADRDQFVSLDVQQRLSRRLYQVQERLLRLQQKVTGFGLASALAAYPSRRFGRSHIQHELL